MLGRLYPDITFVNLFFRVYYKALSAPNLIAAFRKTGIHPFNGAVVDPALLTPGKGVTPQLGLSQNPITQDENQEVTVSSFLQSKVPEVKTTAAKKRPAPPTVCGELTSEEMTKKIKPAMETPPEKENKPQKPKDKKDQKKQAKETQKPQKTTQKPKGKK